MAFVIRQKFSLRRKFRYPFQWMSSREYWSCQGGESCSKKDAWIFETRAEAQVFMDEEDQNYGTSPGEIVEVKRP
jgi:hypothetical protein